MGIGHTEVFEGRVMGEDMALDRIDWKEMTGGKDDTDCRLDSGQAAEFLNIVVGGKIEYSHKENLVIGTAAIPGMDNHRAAVDIAAMVMAVTVMFEKAQGQRISSEREILWEL